MMGIKRKGILAVPGEYKYGDMVEVKDADELKASVDRQKEIMVTYGHPPDGMPSSKDVIGSVIQKWNEDKQRVEGKFLFHEEKIPESIKGKIVNLEPVSISPGFMIDGIDDGIQRGIVYTHVAVLDDEDPRCPLGECGINIRMDSKDKRELRYDQKTELEASEPDPEPEPEPVDAEPEPEPVEEPPPVEEEEPVLEKQEVAEEVVEEIPSEPEVVIPTSTTPKDDSGIVVRDGVYEYVPKLFRDNDKDEE
jgi:hypothetical protein